MIIDKTKNPMSVNASRIVRNPSHVTFSSSVNGGSPFTNPNTSTNANSSAAAVNTGGVVQKSDENPSKSSVTVVNNGINRPVNNWLSKTRARNAEIPAKSANEYIWKKVESLVERMQDETSGVPIKTVKSLMSTVPSVFTGADLVQWLLQNSGADSCSEAVHVGSMIASMGFLFPIADHLLAVRNDAHAFYRFQTPCLYPDRCPEVDNIEYAVYLCKRTMQNKQRLELADFEAERLATLQSFYWHKWEFIYLQAEAEAKVDKKRDKVERLVLESQEKGFWDAARPINGAVNNNDIDMRKLCRAKRPKKTICRPAWFPIPTGADGQLLWSSLESSSGGIQDRFQRTKACAERKRVRVSKVVENLQNYYEQYIEYDMLLAAADTTANNNNYSGIMTSSLLGTLSDVTGNNTAVSGGSGIGGQTTANNSSSNLLTQSTHEQGTSTTNNGLIQSSTNIGSGATNQEEAGNSASANQNNPIPNSISTATNATTTGNNGNNPWITDNVEYWTQETTLKDVNSRRVRRWGFSIHELLKDPAGRVEIQKWLEKEFSAENLTFWELCQDLKGAPLRELSPKIDAIYNQYLSPNAAEPINVDSRVADSVRQRVSRSSGANPDRYCFEEAEEHIFKLMTSDSYYRFLRSNIYKELMAAQKKKSKRKFPADIRQRLEIE